MIVNQPRFDKFGNKLIEKLDSISSSNFKMIVAYAKKSGVSRLGPYLKKFRENGGTIQAIVGIDQFNTSYEALAALMELCDDLFVFHNENLTITFHVKAYCIKLEENKYWTAVGSNNLTAGGLFGNYEATKITEDETNIEELFETYSDLSTRFCHRVTPEFLEELLKHGYIEKESSIRRRNIHEMKRAVTISKKAHLFAASKSETPSTPKGDNPPKKKDAPVKEPAEPRYYPDGMYLLRYIPRAGGRINQVHFTKQNLEEFFHKKADDYLQVQQIYKDGSSGLIENNRKVVYSKRNKNYKIEISGAKMLIDNYPDDPENRPILLLKKVTGDLFEYMILLREGDGYDSLHDKLEGVEKHGNQLPSVQIDSEELLDLWEDCPMI